MNGFYLFSWRFFLEHIVLFQVFFCFPSFFVFQVFLVDFFFRAPGSDPRWSGVDSNLCVLKFHSPGAWPPPKVPTKKNPNTTQLLVNDGKHYFRVGSLSSNFKSLENGPAVPTKKHLLPFVFLGSPGSRGALLLRWFHVLLQSCLCTSAFQGFLWPRRNERSWNSFPFFSLTVGAFARWASMRRFPGFLVCFHRGNLPKMIFRPKTPWCALLGRWKNKMLGNLRNLQGLHGWIVRWIWIC